MCGTIHGRDEEHSGTGQEDRGFWPLLPGLASGSTELRGGGGEDSGASAAGCSATGQMMNHLFPVCRTKRQDKNGW